MSLSNGQSETKVSTVDPEKPTNPPIQARIVQPNTVYPKTQYTGNFKITNQRNENPCISPSMGNSYSPAFQQGMQYGYKPQNRVGEVYKQAKVGEINKVGEFDWLTHTYAINYFPLNSSNAGKISEIVWSSLTAVKKIVIYTNQSNYLKINDQIEKKINKNSLSKITIINQSHPSHQLQQKYAEFFLSQNKILITTKGSAGSFQTGLIDVDDVQMIIFDGVCDADDQYRQRLLRSSALQPNKRGVAITVCIRDQYKLLPPVQSPLKIKFTEFKSYDLAAYLKPKPKTTNNLLQQSDITKKGILDSSSEFMNSSLTKSVTEQVVDLSWITHFYFKPEFSSWKKVVSTLNEGKDNYKKAVVYVSTDNLKKLKVFINEDLVNKHEVQYNENGWESFGEAVNKFAVSPYRILVITKTSSRRIPMTPINADNINFVIIDGILQAKDYKGIFTRKKLPKQEKAVSIIVQEYGKMRKQDLIPLESEIGMKILEWNNQKLSDYLTTTQPQIRPQPECQLSNKIELLRNEKQQQQLRRKEEQQLRKRRKLQQQQIKRRKEQEQEQRRRKAQKQQEQRIRLGRLRGNQRSAGIGYKVYEQKTAGNNGRDASLAAESEKLQRQRRQKQQQINRYKAQLQQQQRQFKHSKQQQQRQLRQMAEKLKQKQQQMASLKRQQETSKLEMRQQNEQQKKLLKMIFEKVSNQKFQMAQIKEQLKKQRRKQNRPSEKSEQSLTYDNDERQELRKSGKLNNNLRQN